MMLGGLSEARTATEETQKIVDKMIFSITAPNCSDGKIKSINVDHPPHVAVRVRSQLEEKENRKFPVFKAVEFKSQVVAGTNYFIKVLIDEDEFVHLRVLEYLPHENKPLVLSDYQTNKTKNDELKYF